MVSVMFVCFADTKKELDSIRTMLISEMVKKSFIPDELKFQQLKAYNFVWNNNIKKQHRIMTRNVSYFGSKKKVEIL